MIRGTGLCSGPSSTKVSADEVVASRCCGDPRVPMYVSTDITTGDVVLLYSVRVRGLGSFRGLGVASLSLISGSSGNRTRRINLPGCFSRKKARSTGCCSFALAGKDGRAIRIK